QLERVRKAYSFAIREFLTGINPLSKVPKKFLRSRTFKAFLKKADPSIVGSAAPDIKKFLQPSPKMKCLDAGCCANLAAYRLDKWPSTYYGIDYSPVVIHEMKKFVSTNNLKIGGLERAEIKDMPYSNNFFDIAMVIGVFEYLSMEYSVQALKELHRVLKPRARMVLDLPNLAHPHIKTMFQLEEYLGRPNIPKSKDEFEQYLTPLFTIFKTKDTHVMLKYFVGKKAR
ncbi:MAG: class I SAM-dependent methyltransferase, partial [Candidatus Aminicenantes bacterium]|nr:class I SAM-dependent methyltransferase [Candidatus Aminicenantes bacterium]